MNTAKIATPVNKISPPANGDRMQQPK